MYGGSEGRVPRIEGGQREGIISLEIRNRVWVVNIKMARYV
jgi:hypothetical protein